MQSNILYSFKHCTALYHKKRPVVLISLASDLIKTAMKQLIIRYFLPAVE